VIGLDTNVLVRYMVRDDAQQTADATRLIESHCTVEEPGVVTLVVLCELVWVLSRGYRYGRDDIARVLHKILEARDLRVERSELAWQALGRYEMGKADFADYVVGLCNRELGVSTTYTFDRRAADSALFAVIDSSPEAPSD